ncbi:MAG: alpha-L-fucosidase [Armatimonadetes bacterium]|nr:alpha-L-fucosidase [Armatimonadota bacterium]
MQLSRRQLLQSALAAHPVARMLMSISPNQDRTLPRIAKFEKLAFGIFVHFGLYSLLQKGEWAMHLHNIPRDEYMKLMDKWEMPDFSGRKLAQLAKSAGAKYITLTSRHHDGFSLYDSHGLDPWDVTKTPAGRDIVREFVDGCRAEGIVPCLYHTTLDWSDPRFENDWKGYQQYLRDSVEIICSNYGPLGTVWFDGNWSRPDADWELDALYSMVRKHQPEALIINNTGIGEEGKLVHPEIDAVTFERGHAERPKIAEGEKVYTGEMCMTSNYHWGSAGRDYNMISPATVIEYLCRTRHAGANFLMNLGPTKTGALPEYETALFHLVGEWVRLFGGDDNPIYLRNLDPIEGEGGDFGVRNGDDAYLFVFDLTATADPRASGTTARGTVPRTFKNPGGPYNRAVWMDSGQELKIDQDGGSLTLHPTGYPYGTNTVVRVAKLVRA